jgi:hypothetical protein
MQLTTPWNIYVQSFGYMGGLLEVKGRLFVAVVDGGVDIYFLIFT